MTEFTLREYLISISENMGATIDYDEKWVSSTVQAVYAASLTWAKGYDLKSIADWIVFEPKIAEA